MPSRINLIILLFFVSTSLPALDFSTDVSTDLQKKHQRYLDDVEELRADLRKEISKQQGKLLKVLRKLDKTMRSKGQLDGLRPLGERLNHLTGRGGAGDLFSAQRSAPSAPAVVDLPQEAQELEQNYQALLSQLISVHLSELFELRDEFIEDLEEEVRQLMKKDQIDQAGQLRSAASQFSDARLSSVFQPVVNEARCLMTIDVATLSRSFTWSRQNRAADGVVFAWYNAAASNAVLDGRGRPLAVCRVQARGRSYIDSGYVMRLREGACIAEDPAREHLLQACKQNNQLSIEAVIQSDHLNQWGPARIVSFSRDAHQRHFTLGQEGGELILRLRTQVTSPNGTDPDTRLGQLREGPNHIVISYSPGNLQWWLNGEHDDNAVITGDFRNWDDQQYLVFGDEYLEPRPWLGRLWGIRIRAQALEAAHARAAWQQFQNSIEEPVEPETIGARLVAAAKIPDARSILPQRQALVADVFESEDGRRFELLRWAVLDGKPEHLPRQVGAYYELRREPMSRHPQLKEVPVFAAQDNSGLPRYVQLEADEHHHHEEHAREADKRD